ncbi:hypothetical protein ACN2XU_10205 [Primorskyibacter sp. 2E107]|uniref:hypothetical protein n=1 Tax=Primorskyibacter sp. 2E107 TaxID=3403458 RepID=UPI003AF64308
MATSVAGFAGNTGAAPADDWREMVDACAAFLETGAFTEPEDMTLTGRRDLGEDHLLCFDSLALDARPVPGCNVIEATFEGRSYAGLELQWREDAASPDSFERAKCFPNSTRMESRKGIPDALSSWFKEAEASGRVVAVKEHVWDGCSRSGRKWRVAHAHEFGPILWFSSLKSPCNS